MLRVGRFEVFSVVNGVFRLDGGAMFGVVPRVLWEKRVTPDASNRIPLAMRTLVALDRKAGRLVIADTGAGGKWAPRDAERYAIEDHPTALSDALRPLGFSQADVTDVIVTHLHFDHAGGMTRWLDEPGGELTLQFPAARHWIHARHLRHALEPSARDQASYLNDDFELLHREGRFEVVDGDEPDAGIEGIRWWVSNGHTPCQLLPWIEDPVAPLLFVGDMVPTHNHLPPAWLMAYDLYPLTTLDEKNRVLRSCLDHNLLLAFPHDPQYGGVAVEMRTGRPIVSRTLEL